MIQAVILDLDNTLYDYNILDGKARENTERFTCKRLGISRERYEEAYHFGKTETKRRLADVGAGHNRLLYFQKALEYLDVLPIPLALQMYEQYWGFFLKEMRLYDGAKELLDYLRRQQITIMICTDLTAHIQHRKIEALGIAPYIRYLVSSEEAGREKPAQEAFALCLEKLQICPENVLYVGDSFEKDVEGALRAGMNAVWFQPVKGQDLDEDKVDKVEIEAETAAESGPIEPKTAGKSYLRVENYAQLKEYLVRRIHTTTFPCSKHKGDI